MRRHELAILRRRIRQAPTRHLMRRRQRAGNDCKQLTLLTLEQSAIEISDRVLFPCHFSHSRTLRSDLRQRETGIIAVPPTVLVHLSCNCARMCSRKWLVNRNRSWNLDVCMGYTGGFRWRYGRAWYFSPSHISRCGRTRLLAHGLLLNASCRFRVLINRGKACAARFSTTTSRRH